MGIRDLWKDKRIENKIAKASKDKTRQQPTRALGTGPINRHGMPQLPVGQHEVKKWPVLDLGVQPSIPKEEWRLTIDGQVNNPVTLDWKAFNDLPQMQDTSDFHCVTSWSRMDIPWSGVQFAQLMELVQPTKEASHLFIHAYDQYTTNLSLEDAMVPDVMLVHTAFGKPLERVHGGPVRMITPRLYAWKGAKWIQRIEVVSENKLGFWEQRGYSNTARPWENDRYS